jgi:hypothetical protein
MRSMKSAWWISAVRLRGTRYGTVVSNCIFRCCNCVNENVCARHTRQRKKREERGKEREERREHTHRTASPTTQPPTSSGKYTHTHILTDRHTHTLTTRQKERPDRPTLTWFQC